MCVRMVDMRIDAIMIENLILTMSRYFILRKNRSITNINKLSAYAIINFGVRLTPNLIMA